MVVFSRLDRPGRARTIPDQLGVIPSRARTQRTCINPEDDQRRARDFQLRIDVEIPTENQRIARNSTTYLTSLLQVKLLGLRDDLGGVEILTGDGP